MQLDKTRIAIRERNFTELLDLALHVLREHAGPLALAFVVGVAPVALFNYWLLGGALSGEVYDYEDVLAYVFVNGMLICFQIPLATAPMTLYLGQALFVERPSPARIVRDFAASLGQLTLFQVIVRGVVGIFVLTLPVLYLGWPYLTEIILLERNPWRKRSPQGTSTLTRSGNMHARNRGELFGRWLASAVIGLMFVLILWRSLWWLAQLLTGDHENEAAEWTVWLPVAIWLTVGYFTVVRFLSYLDLRIRTEGWEVELLLRAEAARLTRQLT
ncbi:MAG TPA: hypothetical protein VFW87_13805 [Pirellulales bacterium]|nr:hypothetical protein [Pirellulales bacterium]